MGSPRFGIVKGAVKRGRDAEKIFWSTLEKHNYHNVRKATQHEDRKMHIDIWGTTNHGFEQSFDVKSMKKVNGEIQDKLHCLELKNVYGGDGWIHSKADFIAFELEKSFLCVKPKKLHDYIKKYVTDEHVKKWNDCLHKLYSRRGCEDLMTMASVDKLMEYGDLLLNKGGE